MTPPLPLAEAQERLLAAAEPLPSERVTAEQAIGRCLAEPLVAARTQPAADLSAMDGYVVRADDPAGPWRVIGESAAGHPFAGELQAGDRAKSLIEDIDERFLRHHGHAAPHGHPGGGRE